mgnify:CR=1 FL=1
MSNTISTLDTAAARYARWESYGAQDRMAQKPANCISPDPADRQAYDDGYFSVDFVLRCQEPNEQIPYPTCGVCGKADCHEVHFADYCYGCDEPTLADEDNDLILDNEVLNLADMKARLASWEQQEDEEWHAKIAAIHAANQREALLLYTLAALFALGLAAVLTLPLWLLK